MKIAIFPGSFNPFTKGHHDIVCRALTIFDKIVIGIGYNPEKPQPEDLQERLQQIKALYNNDARVEVGKSVQDFEYERTQAEYNRMLSNGIETVFLFANPLYASLSSSLVRTLKTFGKDISDLLP